MEEDLMEEEIRKFCNRWDYEEDEKTYVIDELTLIIKKAKEERDKEINEFIIKVSSLIHIDKMNEFEELIKKFKGKK